VFYKSRTGVCAAFFAMMCEKSIARRTFGSRSQGGLSMLQKEFPILEFDEDKTKVV